MALMVLTVGSMVVEFAAGINYPLGAVDVASSDRH